MCLNEYYLFFLLSGAFMGYSYSLLYFINHMNYLPFPVIQVTGLNAFAARHVQVKQWSKTHSLFIFLSMAAAAAVVAVLSLIGERYTQPYMPFNLPPSCPALFKWMSQGAVTTNFTPLWCTSEIGWAGPWQKVNYRREAVYINWILTAGADSESHLKSENLGSEKRKKHIISCDCVPAHWKSK